MKENNWSYKYEHQRKSYKRYVTMIRKDTDKQLLDKLDSVESKSDYIYSLIRKDVYGDKNE